MKGGGKGNDHWKGKGKGGKGLNAFDGQAWAPQPQAAQQGQEPNQLMTNTWNGNPGNDWNAWNGQAGNFGGLNLGTLATNKIETKTCTRVTNIFKALQTEDEDDDEETTKQSAINLETTTKKGCTMGEFIDKAKEMMNNKKTKDNKPKKGTIHKCANEVDEQCENKVDAKCANRRDAGTSDTKKKKVRFDTNADGKEDKIYIGCLTSATPENGQQNLCAMHEDYEHIEVMIDSGASETVASEDKFGTYPLEKTSETGILPSVLLLRAC